MSVHKLPSLTLRSTYWAWIHQTRKKKKCKNRMHVMCYSRINTLNWILDTVYCRLVLWIYSRLHSAYRYTCTYIYSKSGNFMVWCPQLFVWWYLSYIYITVDHLFVIWCLQLLICLMISLPVMMLSLSYCVYCSRFRFVNSSPHSPTTRPGPTMTPR